MKKLQIITTLFSPTKLEIEYILSLKEEIELKHKEDISFWIIDTSTQSEHKDISDQVIPGTKLNAIKNVLDKVDADYLKILDPDDELILSELKKTISEFNFENLVLTNWIDSFNGKIKKKKNKTRMANYTSFYKVSTLKRVSLFLDETIYAGDDYHMANVLLSDKYSIKKIKTYPYQYTRLNPNSITNEKRDYKKWEMYIDNNDKWFMSDDIKIERPYFLNIIFRKNHFTRISFYKKYKKFVKNKFWFAFCVFLKWRLK